MSNRCKNCTGNCSNDSKDKFQVLLTAADVKEMVKLGGRLEGYWIMTVQVPARSNPFVNPILWSELVDNLTEHCGVKITTLKFELGMNIVGYQFALRED